MSTIPSEIDKDFNKAARHIFKQPELKVLIPEAQEACEHIGVKPETLVAKSQNDFPVAANEAKELAVVRYNHYTKNRK